MAHHHHHHHHQEEQQDQGYGSPYPASDPPYTSAPGFGSESPYVNPPAAVYGQVPGYYESSTVVEQERVSEYEREKKKEKHHEHLGEAAALAGGVFAMYEKHEMKVDPENARRHKVEEEIGEAVAVGGAGYGFYEHHEVKKTEHHLEEAQGKHHHHHHLF